MLGADAVPADLGKMLIAAGWPETTRLAITWDGTTSAQQTVVSTLGRIGPDLKAAGVSLANTRGSAIAVVGEAVAARDQLSWFETKPLFGWRVLVPRTKEQAAVVSQRLREYGAVPEEVPTIAVEPPRTPQQMERAVKGLVTGRYQWIAFTSVNAVRAVREKFEEYGLDARAFAGVKVAAVGEQTAAALLDFGIRPDLVPDGEQSAAGPAEDWPPYDDVLDPINRVLLPRADIATETLVAGLIELGWEVDDVTAYRTVRAAPPPAPIREAIKGGGFDAVLFTSSSTVRNLVGIAGKPHAVTVIAVHRPADRQDRGRVRAARRRDRAEAVDGVAGRGAGRVRCRRCGTRPSRRENRFASRASAAAARAVRLRVGRTDRDRSFPVARPRRLRRTPALRRLVAETSLRPRELVLPVFVKEGISEPQPIGSMPGVVQHTRDSLRKAAAEAAEAGVGGLILFGVPAVKDGRGSAADDPAGISQLALADLRAEVGDDCVIMADLCLCEYTDHGHCGVLAEDGDVDNDATLERYASIAVAQAEAGAHLVAPSGMMDGQVAAIRAALDAAGHGDVGICAYSAKYASGFYGPFREAAEGAPAFGDRASLPAGPGQRRRGAARGGAGRRRGRRHGDGQAGPGLPGRHRRVADAVDVPVAAYQVSGEYAMVEAAAANGWLDRDRIISETLTAIRRAGASVILTYWAAEVARRLAR